MPQALRHAGCGRRIAVVMNRAADADLRPMWVTNVVVLEGQFEQHTHVVFVDHEAAQAAFLAFVRSRVSAS